MSGVAASSPRMFSARCVPSQGVYVLLLVQHDVDRRWQTRQPSVSFLFAHVVDVAAVAAVAFVAALVATRSPSSLDVVLLVWLLLLLLLLLRVAVAAAGAAGCCWFLSADSLVLIDILSLKVVGWWRILCA